MDWAYISPCKFYDNFNDYAWDIQFYDISQDYFTIRLAL